MGEKEPASTERLKALPRTEVAKREGDTGDEAQAKVTEKATSGIKQTMQTQV